MFVEVAWAMSVLSELTDVWEGSGDKGDTVTGTEGGKKIL